jgi:two-component system sensor histidine kinase TctE
VLLPLAAFVFVTGSMAYHAARQTADLVQDGALLASARAIAEDVGWSNGAIVSDIPPVALEIFESPYRDHVFYRVAMEDRLLGGTPDLALPPPSPSSGAGAAYPVFYDTSIDGQPIRAVAFQRHLYDSGKSYPVTVVVGKTEASREAMLESLWRPQLVRQAMMLVLAVALVLVGLTTELKPLMRLKDDVADREPTELEPIRVTHLHSELRPIVDAINRCIARLKLHATRQRQFVADAAHQLRTPLTVLDTQLQYACQCAPGDPALGEVLTATRRTSRQMIDMTNQLLLLAQVESAAPAAAEEPIDMASVVASVLEELATAAERRCIDLGAELGEGVLVAGNESLLRALAANLIDNAIRYTQEGGCVTASCRRDGDNVVFEVIDDGPGIPAESRERVFERFYRGRTDVQGSGLGLSIVRHIATMHGGSVALAPAAELGSGAGQLGRGERSREGLGLQRTGLVATVRLPAWRTPNARTSTP